MTSRDEIIRILEDVFAPAIDARVRYAKAMFETAADQIAALTTPPPGEVPALNAEISRLKAIIALPPEPTQHEMFNLGNGEAINFNPGGKFHGWKFRRHADGHLVSVCALLPMEPLYESAIVELAKAYPPK